MTENHHEIVELLENGEIELKIKLDLRSALDVAIKNYLLIHRSASSVGVITYEQMWDQLHNSLEIHQETMLIMHQLFDIAKGTGNEQATDKK